MAAKGYERDDKVYTAMILVCIFHFIYVADCLFYEASIATMVILKLHYHVHNKHK